MLIGGAFWLFVLLALLFLIGIARRGPPRFEAPRRSPGLRVLEERYARGEIERDEYLQKKKDLTE